MNFIDILNIYLQSKAIKSFFFFPSPIFYLVLGGIIFIPWCLLYSSVGACRISVFCIFTFCHRDIKICDLVARVPFVCESPT